MAALVNELKNIIKSDLMKKVRTTLAFKMFDKWWEKAERQLKVMLYFLNCFFDLLKCLNLFSLPVLLMKSVNLSNQLLISIVPWKVKQKIQKL